VIALSEGALAEIRAHGMETYPEECCGALLGAVEGSRPKVIRVERLENSRGSERQRRFWIAPEEYQRVEKLAEGEGLALLGFYHSHPDHPAVPSEYDREQALPFFHYLIMTVLSGCPGDVTAWVLSEDRGSFDLEESLVEAPGE